MARPRKNDIEKQNGHRFYSTDFQYERMANFASDCGITVSQFLQKVAEALKDEKDKARLMKLLKLTEADSAVQKKLRDQRAGRTGLLIHDDDLPGQTDLFEDKEREEEEREKEFYFNDNDKGKYH